jgi:type I restriction enzyme S subunit
MGNENVLNGKYTDYPDYKNTGIIWLPTIPENWQVLPLKLVLASKVKDGPHETPKFLDEGIPFFSVDGIQSCKLVFEGCRYISQKDHDRFSMKCLPKFGDVLLGKAASVGKVAFVDTKEEFNVWSPLAVLTPKSVKLGKFIFYSLQSTWLQAQCDVNSNSNTQKNLSMGVIDNLSFAIPSDAVADKIACFLDHETAKIDTLIDKQKQLIKLLKEKRQAVISHAVTKGLNPGAPMRDSGVKSIGNIPKHWIIKSLSLASKKLAVGLAMSVTDSYEDEGIPIIRNQNIKEGYFDGRDMLYLNPSFAESQSSKKVKAGDIVIVRTGSNVGLACCVPDEYDQCHTFTTLIVTPSDDLVKEYFTYCMNSVYGKAEVNRLKFGFGKDNLNVGELRAMHTLLPGVKEQNEIVAFLGQEVAKVELMVSKAHIAIELMKERRTALISAAVTGKIDLRHWQAPAASILQGVIND